MGCVAVALYNVVPALVPAREKTGIQFD